MLIWTAGRKTMAARLQAEITRPGCRMMERRADLYLPRVTDQTIRQ